MSEARSVGKFVNWIDERGFGFVRLDGRDYDIFVHYTGLLDKEWQPQPGDRVSLIEDQDGTGRRVGRRVEWIE